MLAYMTCVWYFRYPSFKGIGGKGLSFKSPDEGEVGKLTLGGNDFWEWLEDVGGAWLFKERWLGLD